VRAIQKTASSTRRWSRGGRPPCHANFTGDTFEYNQGTLTVIASNGIPILTMQNLTGANLTSGSFFGVGDAIQIKTAPSTFTWSAGTTGDWNSPSNWTLTNGVGHSPFRFNDSSHGHAILATAR
jgi:hypothetical protein